MKESEMGGYVAHTEMMKNAYNILAWRSEGQRWGVNARVLSSVSRCWQVTSIRKHSNEPSDSYKKVFFVTLATISFSRR
jgi:hypothetical protein